MELSENTLKWVIRCYPPLLFQRIWVIGFYEKFKGVKVKINKSFLNKNYNGSIFGGTIFSAVDPFYPVLFNQLLNKGLNLKIWSKSAKIDFLKPAVTDLYFNIYLTDNDITEANESLINTGKYKKLFTVDIYNVHHEICASTINEVYIRDTNYIKHII